MAKVQLEMGNSMNALKIMNDQMPSILENGSSKV
jgi:hypothetical protein